MITHHPQTADAPAEHFDITEATLLNLRHGGPERAMGELTADDQRTLAAILPDLVDELLAHRKRNATMAEVTAPNLAISFRPEAQALRLIEARETIANTDTATDARVIAQACRAILAWSRNHEERTHAHEVLTQIDPYAA